MLKILTLNKISPSGLDHFDKSKYSYGSGIENPDAAIVRSASMHDMALPESLLAVARAGAGVNNIPIEKCSDQGIVVFNTPGANANAVKELVIASLFMCSRKVVSGIEWVKSLKGTGEIGKQVEKGKSAFTGPEIKGKSLGVVGLGAIGIMVANTAKSLGMNVFGYDPYMSVDSAWQLSRSIKHAASLKDIYANCDYISLHVPLTNETKEMINVESIAAMRDGVRILNFARGDLVNTEDIIFALEDGKIAAYVTDFPADEMLDVAGIIPLPHLGASTPESEDNCASMATEQLINYLENGNITNSVNLPNVNLPRSTKRRICIIHRNIPNVLATISSAISGVGINIEDMLNHSKKDYAYTVLNIDEDIPDRIQDNLNQVEGIIRVRII